MFSKTKKLKTDRHAFPGKEKAPTEGFTLVEVLIYSVLLASLFGMAFVVVNDVLIINDRFIQKNELSVNHEFIERKLEWVFSQAESVDFPAENSTSDSGMAVSVYSTDISPAVFTINGGDLYLALADEEPGALTNTHVNLETFLVEHISNEQSESSVRITVVLETSGTFYSSSKAKYLFVVDK